MDMNAAPVESRAERFHVNFDGVGADYFRIWIVNLLLIVVTLGLFTPAARRRSLIYLYSHTSVAGTPFEFTGALRRMFLGFLIFFGLYIAYVVASNVGAQKVASLLILVWGAFGPWLWVSSKRFRMASTRWRGITGRFTASVGSVYRASWPMIAFIALSFTLAFVMAALGRQPAAAAFGVFAVLAVFAILFLALVRVDYNYTRLRVTQSHFGHQTAEWDVGFGKFVGMAIVATGIYIASALVAGVLAFAILTPFGAFAATSSDKVSTTVVIATFVVGAAIFLLAVAPAFGYWHARKFVLVWGNLRLGETVRFDCFLTPSSFVMLRIKNALLGIVTLGLWRPFAVIREYRMKLESITVEIEGGIDQFTGSPEEQRGAFADAVGEAVGFDFG
jgi:uncharacterized membrane protein YjgN (DUF898 family)